MLDILTDIGSALQKAKQERNIGKTLLVAAIASVLTGVAIMLFPRPLSPKLFGGLYALNAAPMAFFLLSVSILMFLGILIFALLTKIVANALGGKGTYFAGLTAVSYCSFVFAIGLFLAVIFSSIPIIGILLTTSVLALIFFPLSIAVFYRGIKELFETDMITAFVTVACITTGFIVANYFTIILFIALGGGGMIKPMPM